MFDGAACPYLDEECFLVCGTPRRRHVDLCGPWRFQPFPSAKDTYTERLRSGFSREKAAFGAFFTGSHERYGVPVSPARA